MKQIDVMLWDIGNVLLQGIHEELAECIFSKRKSDLSREEFGKSLAAILDESFYGLATLDETWHRMLDLVNVTDQQEAQAIKSSIVVNRNEALIAHLHDFRAQGYRLGIASDLSQIGLSIVMERYQDVLGICERDLVFISVYLGLTKVRDGAAWFTHVLEGLDVKPERVLFIDDDQRTISVAKGLGITSLWYPRDKAEEGWSSANDQLLVRLVELGVEPAQLGGGAAR